MHFNLLDRESQLSCMDAHADTAERPEGLETRSLRHHLEKVFSGLGESAYGVTKTRAGHAATLQARVHPCEQQALPHW